MTGVKKYLSSLLSVTIAFTPAAGFAHRVDDAVDRGLAASRAAATAYAQNEAKKDFGRTVEVLFEHLRSYAKARELTQTYADFTREVERTFADLKITSDVDQTYAALRDFQDRYENGIRQRFLASWIPTIQAAEFKAAREMIHAAIADARQVCKAGRSRREGWFLSSVPAAPEFTSRFIVKPEFRPLDVLLGGVPFSVAYHYAGATAGSAAANADRARFTGVTTTLSNVSNSIVLRTGLVGAYNAVVPANYALATGGGGLSGVMLTAAPYLAAVALLSIVVTDVMARAEASRVNDRVQNALDRQYRRSADYEFANAVYRDTCGAMTDALGSIETVMTALDGPDRARTLADVHAREPELRAWTEASEAEEDRACRADLHTFEKKNGCREVDAISSQTRRRPVPNDLSSNCLIEKSSGDIVALDETCRLPSEDAKRTSALEQIATERRAYAEAYPPARVGQLMTTVVGLAFEDQQSLRRQLWRSGVTRTDQAQTEAFGHLLSYLNIVRRAQAATAEPTSLTFARRARVEIDTLRTDFVRAAERSLDVIFGRSAPGPLEHVLNDLKARTHAAEVKYGAPKELTDLGAAINFTLGELKGAA